MKYVMKRKNQFMFPLEGWDYFAANYDERMNSFQKS